MSFLYLHDKNHSNIRRDWAVSILSFPRLLLPYNWDKPEAIPFSFFPFLLHLFIIPPYLAYHIYKSQTKQTQIYFIYFKGPHFKKPKKSTLFLNFVDHNFYFYFSLFKTPHTPTTITHFHHLPPPLSKSITNNVIGNCHVTI